MQNQTLFARPPHLFRLGGPRLFAPASRTLGGFILLVMVAFMGGLLWSAPSLAQQAPAVTPMSQRPPQELVASVTRDILETIKNDKSLQQRDLRRLSELVDQKVMPVVNFSRMTALAMGRHWRTASPEQQQRLVAAFRDLLMLTYSEALRYAPEATIDIRPARYLPSDEDVIVRTALIRPGKEPIPLDYRLQKTPDGWKIYDFNVLGLWMVEHYRSQFTQLVSAKGVDGLITTLEEKNQALRQAVASGKG